MRLFWFLFSALSYTFFLPEFKPDAICLPFLSASVGFCTCSSFQGQILKQQGMGPNDSSIFGKADLSSGSKQFSASRCFPWWFPSFLGTFLLSLFLGRQILSCFCGILVSFLQLRWVWSDAQDVCFSATEVFFVLSGIFLCFPLGF